MTIRRLTTAGLATLGLALFIATPAQAAPGDALGTGDAGSVDILENGQPITVAPVVPCSSEGPTQGSVGDVSVPGIVRFTNNKSTCTVDAAGAVATAKTEGGKFVLDALSKYSGKTKQISLSKYSANCATTENGSNSDLSLSGLKGITVPQNIPTNYVVAVPGAKGAPPIATVTFNEAVIPDPPDGSMTVNVMHVRLYPEGGGPATGDVVVGSVHCAPSV